MVHEGEEEVKGAILRFYEYLYKGGCEVEVQVLQEGIVFNQI